jgi:hypothetical protein
MSGRKCISARRRIPGGGQSVYDEIKVFPVTWLLGVGRGTYLHGNSDQARKCWDVQEGCVQCVERWDVPPAVDEPLECVVGR